MLPFVSDEPSSGARPDAQGRRYVSLVPLGRGGMGDVELVLDRGDGAGEVPASVGDAAARGMNPRAARRRGCSRSATTPG